MAISDKNITRAGGVGGGTGSGSSVAGSEWLHKIGRRLFRPRVSPAEARNIARMFAAYRQRTFWEIRCVHFGEKGALQRLGEATAEKTEFDRVFDFMADELGAKKLLDSQVLLAHKNLGLGKNLAVMGASPCEVQAAFCLGIEVGRVREVLGDEVADLVAGVEALGEYCYDPAMERNADEREQLTLVMLARLRAVPHMACHVIRAMDQLATLEDLTVYFDQAGSPIVRFEPLFDEMHRGWLTEAAYVGVDLLGRLGYGDKASQLADYSAEYLHPEDQDRRRRELFNKTGLTQPAAAQLLQRLAVVGRRAIAEQVPDALVDLKGRIKALPRMESKVRAAGLEIEEDDRRQGITRTIDAREEAVWAKGGKDFIALRAICQTRKRIGGVVQAIKDAMAQEGFSLREDEMVNKDNGYFARHLTFDKKIGGNKVISCDWQVRAGSDDLWAEWGGASHWVVYKAGLAGREADELALGLRDIREDHNATRRARWEKLVELAAHYSVNYGVRGRGRPPFKNGESRYAYLNRLGWSRVSMVRTYTGGESAESVLEPSFFDVAIALSEESLPNQVPAVVALEMSQMEGGWRGVANGSIVFIDEGRTWEVSMTNIRPMHLPYSWAMLHARELMADAGVARDSCYRYPERAVHVAEGRGALGDAVARFEIADAFKTRSIRIKLPIVKQGAQIKVVCDPLHAAQLAGFGGSLETLYALLYMFKDNTRGKTIIEQRFYAALQATLLQIMVGPSALQLEGSQPYNLAYFIAPDRPGMVRAIYGALLQGGQEVLGIAPAEDDVAADLLERGRSLTCFALPEGRVNLPEEALRALCAGLPAIPEGYLTRRHRLSVRVNRPYREVLPLVFGVFSDEGVNLGNLQVPVRPEGEDAAVGTQLLFEVEIPQRGGGTLRRVLQNLNSRAMRGRGITGGKEMVKGKDRLWEDLDTRSVMTMFPSK